MKPFKVIKAPDSYSSALTKTVPPYFAVSVSNTHKKTHVDVMFSVRDWRDMGVWIDGVHPSLSIDDCFQIFGQAGKGKLLLDALVDYATSIGRGRLQVELKDLLGIN